ncbi:hypothetical protein ADK67_44240 [Saccharothrix sp. NRRL B-16348]|uniref:hypothetical protein n=1 Tax=Saccharothrix sp. NRRL B-16348 TaxID=1415542 RepID=UPI0006ADD734|nr:hypothetical protein [Saccharothrix sp. NRRL B-16348]KOX13343.1 hypothetical protein ADK67_44240 [Saccharothrix sp. NRRL B-16348]
MSIRHDIRTRMFLGGQWEDVTDKVYQRSAIEIERGRSDEESVTNPQTCSLTLDNRSGDFSMRNPMGQWYGSIGRNVPMEVRSVIAEDTFDRTVASGFGTSDSGQTYSGNGFGGTVQASDFNVASGLGTLSVPTTSAYRYVVMDDVSFRNVDVQTDVILPVVNVLGAQLEPGNLILRYQSFTDYYMVRLVVTAAEAVTITFHHVTGGELITPVTTTLTHTGQTLRVRAQAEGQTLRAKVWNASDGEPLDWDVTVHDDTITEAGAVGVRCGVAAGNTNPLPIVFSIDNFTVMSPRFAGEVSNFPTDSDVSNEDRYSAIEAAGILRRLGQGTSPLRSTLRQGIPDVAGTNLKAYWPCEDGKTATSVASGIPGYPAMVVTGSPDFGEYDEFDSTEPLPLVRGSTWVGDIPEYTLSGALDVRFIVTVPDAGWGENVRLIEIETMGSAHRISLSYNSAGDTATLTVNGRDGSTLYDVTAVGFAMSGEKMFWYLRFSQNGANIDAEWGYSAYDALPGVSLGVTTTINNQTVGAATRVTVNPFQSATFDEATMGHIWVRNNGGPLGVTITDLFQAYRGERALDRMIRLCEANGIPLTYVESEADDTTEMGTQRVETLLEQLRECESTDGGTLFESRGVLGLTYRTRRSLYSQAAALTLDVANNDLAHPFRPVEDDTNTVNDVEAKNINGSSAREELSTGRMSVQDYPDGVGRYDSRFDLNVYRDVELRDHASWRLSKGTVDEARWPDVRVDLDSPQGAALKNALLDLDIDDKVVIENTSAVGVYDPVSQLARGTSESFVNHRGMFNVTAAPASPYEIAVLDSSEYVLDSGSSTINEDLTTTETDVTVVTTYAQDLWTTTEEPFDIVIGGEIMTVTAVTGSTSPQVYTVTRSVNGVVKTHSSGAEVHVLDSFRLGL